MSLEGFVRASGAVMGLARESFGPGGDVVAPGGGVGVLSAGAPGSGQAVQGFDAETGRVGADVVALSDQDRAADEQLSEAIAASGVGRQRMDAVIDAAVADVAAMGVSTNTPQGQRALVEAIKRRLEETKGTLDTADNDAATRAAGASTAAGGYDGIGAPTTPAMTAPASAMGGAPAMPAMPSLPMMGGGMPMGGGLPLSPLSNLTSLFGSAGGLAQATGPFADPAGTIEKTAGTGPASPAAAIPLSAVKFEKTGLPKGAQAYRRYIAEALQTMGISDPQAVRNWTNGFMTALPRESGFNPNAVNLGDTNAHGPRQADGAPLNSSRGGAQTIPSTFAANHQPGTSTNIYDPVANLCASMNYLMRRYHVSRDGSNLSSVSQFNPNHAAQGY